MTNNNFLAFFVLFGGARLVFPAPGLTQSAGLEAGHLTTIPAAAQVDLSHLGAHTHENFIRFDTGAVNVARYPGLRLAAHCRLGTDHAALPPGFGALTQDAGPVPTLGPIEHWSIAPDRQGRRYGVRVTVPTRFANWVAGQPGAVRRRYQALHSYSLEIEWQK